MVNNELQCNKIIKLIIKSQVTNNYDDCMKYKYTSD